MIGDCNAVSTVEEGNALSARCSKQARATHTGAPLSPIMHISLGDTGRCSVCSKCASTCTRNRGARGDRGSQRCEEWTRPKNASGSHTGEREGAWMTTYIGHGASLQTSFKHEGFFAKWRITGSFIISSVFAADSKFRSSQEPTEFESIATALMDTDWLHDVERYV